MGLDCFLYKKTYMPYKKGIKPLSVKVNYKTWTDGMCSKTFKNVKYITEEVGYWRKANMIHSWFVENCCGGEDNCETFPVEQVKLRELLRICKDILKIASKDLPWQTYAAMKLPTKEGFFFGDTAYGDFYLDCIKDTVKILEDTLEDADDGYSTYEYNASW